MMRPKVGIFSHLNKVLMDQKTEKDFKQESEGQKGNSSLLHLVCSAGFPLMIPA